ncbi:zinc-dependent metalloprotease [Mariniflexile sp. HMF6888]|uniref:zinc-dependent metalloprotease n=1 Tax=Mariniflexile sp. HMF6888 TaxID=3373086 RepID=UPI0037A225C8
MRKKIFLIQILLIFFNGVLVRAQDTNKPKSFDDFYKAKEMKIEKGYFNIYSSNDHYFIEIPEQTLGEDLFISAQITNGNIAYISSESGIYHFQKGRKNQLDLYQNRSRTFSKDTVDYGMIQSIEKSGLVPAYKSYPIIAMGKNEKSFIIELTQELAATRGIFNLSKPGPINAPDPLRSGLESYRATDDAVVFKGYATESSFRPSIGGKDVNYISAYEFEMIIQTVPNHIHEQKEDNLAYGFNTVDHIEYDTKNYKANITKYVKRWNLSPKPKEAHLYKKGMKVSPEIPIKVWIDPLTPAPFVESVKQALAQWEIVLEEAGWENVFKIVDDETQAYKKINFYWGNGSSEREMEYRIVENQVTGEIVAARVNFMDTPAKLSLTKYLLLCGENDPEIIENPISLEKRKDILTQQLAGVIGQILGLKENYPAVTAFSIEQLQDNEWLKKWGPSATVVGTSMPNYVAVKENNISPKYLLPKVSIYDRDAIAYLYGNRVSPPSLKTTFYAKDNILDPTAQATFISNDLLRASEIGIQKLKNIYPKIPSILNDFKHHTDLTKDLMEFISQSFSLYQYFVNQEAILIGGQMQRTVIKGENEVPVVYVSKKQQLEVLKSLEKHVFSARIEWLTNPELLKQNPINMDKFYIDMSKNILQRLFKKEVLSSLIDAEEKNGKQAFTCDDLFSFTNRVVFLNFDVSSEPTDIQMSTQINVANILVELANANNIESGVNDLKAMIQLYLLQVRDSVEKLMNNDKVSDKVKNNCKLILLRFNKEYFNKTSK